MGALLITPDTYAARQCVCDELCEALPPFETAPDPFSVVAAQLVPEAYRDLAGIPEPLGSDEILFVARTILELRASGRVDTAAAGLCLDVLRHNYPIQMRALRDEVRHLHAVPASA